LGFGVWGLGFGVWGLGVGVWGLGFRGKGLMFQGVGIYSTRAPVFSREQGFWGTVPFCKEVLFVFFPAFPCLYLGIEALFVFFVRPWYCRREGSYENILYITIDRVYMRTSLICLQILILSK